VHIMWRIAVWRDMHNLHGCTAECLPSMAAWAGLTGQLF
jgi:hypothetical protein